MNRRNVAEAGELGNHESAAFDTGNTQKQTQA